LLGVSRRNFLEASVGVVASGVGSPRPAPGLQRSGAKTPPSSVKALVFDVFGTVVNWRTSVGRQVEELGKHKGLTIDGAAFADAWRAQYAPSMDRVRKGELPWTKLDQLHRMSLDHLLPTVGLEGLSESEKVSLNKGWHRLNPWPDAVAGLTRLKRKFIIAPLSNGNISLMTNRPRGLPVSSGLPGFVAERSHDGRGAPGRPSRGQRRRAASGLCGETLGVWQESAAQT
jgi:2-haloalkanoic acid dehalogenase type II